MTSPDTLNSSSFALLTNGSDFSCAVLDQLQHHNFLPQLIVLPEYPPASADTAILQVNPEREFLSLVGGIELAYAPRSLQQQCAEKIRQMNLDFILVACWPYLIESKLRECPKQKSLNLHPSVLPRFRGANPIQQQIATKDGNAGVTLHLLDAQFDRGDIIKQQKFSVDEMHLDKSYLEARCAKSGVELFIAAVQSGPGRWQPQAQTNQALETD